MKLKPSLLVGAALAGLWLSSAEAHEANTKCFNMHGSIAPDVGHPTFRIKPETFSGLIALKEVDSRGKEIDPLPLSVRTLFPTDQRAVETSVTGDFLICPLEPPRPGRLRLARMADARNLVVHTDRWLEQKR
jgi:hypothetical protein